MYLWYVCVCILLIEHFLAVLSQKESEKEIGQNFCVHLRVKPWYSMFSATNLGKLNLHKWCRAESSLQSRAPCFTLAKKHINHRVEGNFTIFLKTVKKLQSSHLTVFRGNVYLTILRSVLIGSNKGVTVFYKSG